MTAPTIAEMLKYANLQIAAEALYDFRAKEQPSQVPGDINSLTGHYNGAINPAWLTTGNEHASRFAPTEATKFVGQWAVVDHLSNTTSGFSGTLFRALKDDPAQGIVAGDLVLSIRSTEFIDDLVRDCVATNGLEIKTFGWAFGQIADMEAWYAQLKASGKLPAGARLDVTGYSLGAHLATAFNLLHQSELNGGRVVTFNGAGVGQLRGDATLAGVIERFNQLRNNPSDIAALITDDRLRAAYLTLSGRIHDGEPVLPSDYALLDRLVPDASRSEFTQKQFQDEKARIRYALDRIQNIQSQVTRIELGHVTDSQDGAPAAIPHAHIEQENFDYQMAVLIVREDTLSKRTPLGIYNALLDNKSPGTPFLGNQFDIVGRETTTHATAMVANSQWHHGTNIDVFIEDQPLLRGNFTIFDVQTYWDTGALVPINEYTQNDFGDTHSIVLIIDSLNVQNLLKTLVPEATQAQIETLFKAASAAKADSATGTQGKAEGDVLENVLNGLSSIFLGSAFAPLAGKLEGNTWANFDDRTAFYNRLDAVVQAIQDANLAGKLTLSLPDANRQVHYGVDAHVFIEDQPLYRGNALTDAARTSIANSGVKLLVSGYNENDFGDTHSLVLIIDSLNVQNLLKTLAPESTQDQIETLFKAASAAKASSDAGTQGKAEGDPLENILDGLSRLFLAVDPLTRDGHARNGDDLLTGNTWADADHRARFYTGLDAVAGSIAASGLAGKLTLTLQGGDAPDILTGGQHRDRLEGGSGNDLLAGGLGADLLHGDGSESSNPHDDTQPQYVSNDRRGLRAMNDPEWRVAA